MSAPQGYAVQSGQPMQTMYAPQPGQPMYAPQPGQPMYAPQPGQPMYAPQPGQPMYAPQPGQPMYPGQIQGAPMAYAPTGPMPGQPVMMAPVGYAYATPEDPWAPLQNADMLLVEQEMSLLEAITGGMYEAKNKYKIFTGDGVQQFYAMEESECFARCCCKNNADMTLHIHAKDMNGPVIFQMMKPYKCCCPVFGPCCQREATVKLQNGEDIGFIQQPCLGGGFKPVIHIYDKKDGQLQSTLTGPCCCVGGLCCDSKFDLTDAHGQPMGEFVRKAAKDMASLGRQAFTDADKYTMSFNAATDVKVKATMVGLLLYLDYLFFEGDGAFKCDGNSCSIKCFDWVCCGCPCPCAITCAGDDNNGGSRHRY